ncbi:MAG: hypothetical protein ACLTE2_11090 [Eubacteriales bacterium]
MEQEFAGCVELANYMLSTLGLDEDISYRFSKWDENDKEKYIGSPQEWKRYKDVCVTIFGRFETLTHKACPEKLHSYYLEIRYSN